MTGKEEDVEVGLQYFGKRFLNPLLGRWVSADPLAVHAPGEADLNLYAYVSGAVLKNIDPLGLETAKGMSDQEVSDKMDAEGVALDLDSDEFYTPGHDGEVPNRAEPTADQINDNSAACFRGEAIPGAAERSGAALVSAGKAILSIAPGAGEGMDVDTLFVDEEATTFDEAMAAVSLAVSVMTLGFAPNYSAFRGVDEIGGGGDDLVDVYRGVHGNHPAASSAQEGLALPAGGSATLDEHVLGDWDSNFTSWSTSESTAETFARGEHILDPAKKPTGPGTVIHARVPRSSLLTPSPDLDDMFHYEAGVYLEGSVKGTPRTVPLE